MARSTDSPVQRQLNRVSRRLFTQLLLDSLFWCLAGALALATGWFLVQPFVAEAAPEWVRWAVAGGVTTLAVIAAVVLAMVRRPSTVTAALSMDEQFDLRERVTTSLMLAPHQVGTPVAQALLSDVNERVAKLDVRSRFPLRLSWNAALLPLAAAMLALVAFFYEPASAKPPVAPPEEADKIPNAEEIEKKIAQAKLERKKPEKDVAKPDEKADDLRKFEEDFDRILSKGRDSKEQLEKRIDELEALKKKMEEQLKEKNAEKSQALKDQLQQADRLSKKQQSKDGPGKDLENALKKGDLDKAKEEIDKLAKKLKDKELSKEDQDKLQEQLKDMKDQLQRLSRQEEEEEKLQELARRGDIDEETLNRELEQLRKNSEKLQDNLKDLEEIAQQLGECQRCMKDGDAEGAAKALQRARGKMDQLDRKEEFQQLARQVEEIRRSMCRGCKNGEGGNPVPGAGRRPEEKDETASDRTRIGSEADPKGRKEIVGTAPGMNFRRPMKPEDLVNEIKQAAQEAPEALERQRIPRAAADITKGFIENLGGQKEPAKNAPKP